MRADRLLQIMLLLQSRGAFTTRELAERLEVSERTVHRDMEALGVAGVPVYAERGAKGGWRLADGYRMEWSGLDRDELLSLLASKPQRHLADLGLGGAYEQAVLKLLASLSPSARRDAEYMRQRVFVDAAGWHPGGEEVPYLALAQEAVWEGRKLRMAYVAGGSAEPGERVVDPLGLVLKGTLWYLVASREDGEIRSYRVSRVREAELLEAAAVRPAGFDLAAYWRQSVGDFRSRLPRYPARAYVHPDSCRRLEQTRFVRVIAWHKEEACCSRCPDGWREAELEFHTPESARDILLGFGASILVLEPAELRSLLHVSAKDIARMYEDEWSAEHTGAGSGRR